MYFFTSNISEIRKTISLLRDYKHIKSQLIHAREPIMLTQIWYTLYMENKTTDRKMIPTSRGLTHKFLSVCLLCFLLFIWEGVVFSAFLFFPHVCLIVSLFSNSKYFTDKNNNFPNHNSYLSNIIIWRSNVLNALDTRNFQFRFLLRFFFPLQIFVYFFFVVKKLKHWFIIIIIYLFTILLLLLNRNTAWVNNKVDCAIAKQLYRYTLFANSILLSWEINLFTNCRFLLITSDDI